MSWTLEEIDDLNPPSPGQSRSRLTHLRAAGALLPDALCETAEQLERRTEPHVALLFQLPHAIRLEPKWHEVAAHERGVQCGLKAYDALLCVRAGAELELRRPAEVDETATLGASVTQMAAIFPVWESGSYSSNATLHASRGVIRRRPSLFRRARVGIRTGR